MSNTEVGVLITKDQPRDAIHIAVAPVRAAVKLDPGQPIQFVDGSDTDVEPAPRAVSIGIVDPFLAVPVNDGRWFWMFLHPNTITSLKHNWTHPAFRDEEAPKRMTVISENWLRRFCDDHDCPYDGLIAAAKSKDGEWVAADNYRSVSIGDGYISVQGQDASGEIPDEFWDHLENVTGKQQRTRPNYFSCSC